MTTDELREQPAVQGLVQLAHNAIDRINELENEVAVLKSALFQAQEAAKQLANQKETSSSPVAVVTGKWIERNSDNLRTCISVDLPIGTPLYTAPSPAIPEGYALVPVEATGEMLWAGCNDLIQLRGLPTGGLTAASECWRAMIAAAQKEMK